MSILWKPLEAGAALIALSLLSPSPFHSSPLLCIESPGFLPGNYLQSILSQAACLMKALNKVE